MGNGIDAFAHLLMAMMLQKFQASLFSMTNTDEPDVNK